MMLPARFCVPGMRWLSALLLCQLFAVADAAIEHNTVENYLQAHRAAGHKPNRLIDQKSPYLLQHAYNPVQWYAWGEQAFTQARLQDKPIFLSIGYSTCYWCHVMAHESFENDEIAAILNEHFIAVKLDREERPDIDNVYMAATQLVNGYGGWPMTVFLNHALEPFHAGVYYPPVSTDGNIGLTELLQKVVALWRDDRDRVNKVAAQISKRIKAAADESLPASRIDTDVRTRALSKIAATYDSDYGGFGAAPKFPRAGIFAFLLDVAAGDDNQAKQARRMMRETLVAMSQGGIYDHVGGGFHRYAVDAQWQVPHFEKMLYTQALMSLAYTRLYRIEPQARYRDVASGVLDFALREMRDANGGFYSALDASSERPGKPGVDAEGAYYLWSAKQLNALLDDAEWAFVRRYYAIEAEGNITSDPQGEFGALNILHVSQDFRHKTLTDRQAALLGSARKKLYRARLDRPRPHLDDKIITAWNGMMITALVSAAEVFKRKDYLEAATQAAASARDRLVDLKTHRLYRRLRDGEVGISATLADYVWYVNGLLALYVSTGEKSWLRLATQLTEQQVALFYDQQSGGFYESAVDSHSLFRSRTVYDGALPAANAVAVDNLDKLAALTGSKRWQQLATDTVASFAGSINRDPGAAGWMLSVIGQSVNSGEGKVERKNSDGDQSQGVQFAP